MVLPFHDPPAAAKARARRDRGCRAGWGCMLGLHDGNRFGNPDMTLPPDHPSPVRILSALERQSSAWIRTGPRSIEHAGLRVRLTMGIISVRIAHMVPDGDPVPIPAAPATRDRIAALLEDRLRSATGADRNPDDMARGANDIGL